MLGGHTLVLTAGPLRQAPLVDRLNRHSAARGNAPDDMVVTCPISWGNREYEFLRQGRSPFPSLFPPTATCTDAEAAAIHYASRARRSNPATRWRSTTWEARPSRSPSWRNTGTGSRSSGRRTARRFGGTDVDEAVFQHVLAQLHWDHVSVLDRSDPLVADLLSRLRRTCVDAKETLSSASETTIPVSLPDLTTSVRLTRAGSSTAWWCQGCATPSSRCMACCTRRTSTGRPSSPPSSWSVAPQCIPLVGDLLQML